MTVFPIFLSVVLEVKNQATLLDEIIKHAAANLASLVADFELIIVDNASSDESIAKLKALTSELGIPNLQVYALTKEVDSDTAAWVGLENALGDYVAVIDPLGDDIRFLRTMLEAAVSGAEVVFAKNKEKRPQSMGYRLAEWIFNSCYKRIAGVDLGKDAPHYRMLSKRVVNFILQHPQPSVTYRHLPATGGFQRANLEYSALPKAAQTKRLGENIDRGMRLLVSTSRAPMRLVTLFSLFGAGANVMYSIYVVAIALFKADVAPGWISLSLQQSGMFFLISIVLLVLGEYIVTMASFSNAGPLYHVGQEFTSARMTRRERLNIDEGAFKPNNSLERHAEKIV